MSELERKKQIINASEVGQYHFCSVAWFLQKKGYKNQSSSLKRGEEKHQIYGKKMMYLKKKYFVRILYIGGVLCLLVAFFLLWFEGYF